MHHMRRKRNARRTGAAAAAAPASDDLGAASTAPGPLTAVVSGRVAFVVDDERMNRTLLAAVLSRWGMRVTGMQNGRELISTIQALCACPSHEWPAFVTLDVEMPVLDGRRTLQARAALLQHWAASSSAAEREAASRLAQLPIIVVSGNVRAEDQAQMLSLGAAAVVAKPVDLERLADTITSVCPALTTASLIESTFVVTETHSGEISRPGLADAAASARCAARQA